MKRPAVIFYRVLEILVVVVTYAVLGLILYRAVTWLF
jgi:hypothetical protein